MSDSGRRMHHLTVLVLTLTAVFTQKGFAKYKIKWKANKTSAETLLRLPTHESGSILVPKGKEMNLPYQGIIGTLGIHTTADSVYNAHSSIDHYVGNRYNSEYFKNATQVKRLFTPLKTLLHQDFSADLKKGLSNLQVFEVDLSEGKQRVDLGPHKSIDLVAGEDVQLLWGKNQGDQGSKRIFIPYRQFGRYMQAGDPLALDDKKLELKVISVDKKGAIAKVVRGGPLLAGKGIANQGREIPVELLNNRGRLGRKNRVEIELTLRHLAPIVQAFEDRLGRQVPLTFNVSFLEAPEQLDAVVATVKEVTQELLDKGVLKRKPLILFAGKIETRKGIENLPSLVKHPFLHHVMGARGDLSQIFDDLDGATRKIVQTANRFGTPAKIATKIERDTVEKFKRENVKVYIYPESASLNAKEFLPYMQGKGSDFQQTGSGSPSPANIDVMPVGPGIFGPAESSVTRP